MDINQLKPAEIVRDEYGSWIHPEYSKYLDQHHKNQEWLSQDEWNQVKRYFNIETVQFYLEACVSEDTWEKMMDDTDLSEWNPVAPDGFFLMDIHFTEDDAVAVFAREKLWSVNIPEEPDSTLLHPVPSQKIGNQLVERLKKEAVKRFSKVGQCIADAITLEVWNSSKEDHEKYLQENHDWWNKTTFLDDEVA